MTPEAWLEAVGEYVFRFLRQQRSRRDPLGSSIEVLNMPVFDREACTGRSRSVSDQTGLPQRFIKRDTFSLAATS